MSGNDNRDNAAYRLDVTVDLHHRSPILTRPRRGELTPFVGALGGAITVYLFKTRKKP
jgi:hypothetical protein